MDTPSQFGCNVRLEGARIAGIVAAIPSRRIDNRSFESEFGERAVAEIAKMTGVETRYWAAENVTAADLCVGAAQHLLSRLEWDPRSVGALIYVTQTPDLRMPATACTLQARLGLSTACAALDVNLGCSGYPYGLWLAMSLLRSGLDRVLLLVGDTISKTVDAKDRSTALLFGDAGSATAIERGCNDELAQFVLGSDGSGARNLMIPAGGFRHSVKDDARLLGRDESKLFMDGGEIFNFTLRAVPGLVSQVLEAAGAVAGKIDSFVFHQANLFMLRHLARKLKIDSARFPVNIERYGNTSSASIPLVITSELGQSLRSRRMTMVLAGFGVGYSWAATVIPVGPLRCAEVLTL